MSDSFYSLLSYISGQSVIRFVWVVSKRLPSPISQTHLRHVCKTNLHCVLHSAQHETLNLEEGIQLTQWSENVFVLTPRNSLLQPFVFIVVLVLGNTNQLYVWYFICCVYNCEWNLGFIEFQTDLMRFPILYSKTVASYFFPLFIFSRSWTMQTSGFSRTKMVGQSSWSYRITHQNTLRSESITGLLQAGGPPLLPMMSTCSEWRILLLSLMLMVHKFMLRCAWIHHIGYDGSAGQVRQGQRQLTCCQSNLHFPLSSLWRTNLDLSLLSQSTSAVVNNQPTLTVIVMTEVRRHNVVLLVCIDYI